MCFKIVNRAHVVVPKDFNVPSLFSKIVCARFESTLNSLLFYFHDNFCSHKTKILRSKFQKKNSGVYGFVLLPPGWTSFSHPDESPPNFESIQQMVGNYSYLALAMILMIQFCTRIGLAGIITMYIGEIFPFK